MTDPVGQQNGPVPHWPDAQPTLAGDGVLLRPWADSDADDVYRACQDPAIQRFTTVPVPYLREHAEVFVGPFQQKNWAERRGASFAVTDPSSGELLGACSLVGLDLDHLRSGAGYWTAPHARGRGVTARALRRPADWALLELGLHEVVVEVEEGNPASKRLAERAGFRPGDVEPRWEEHRGAPRLFLTLVRARS